MTPAPTATEPAEDVGHLGAADGNDPAMARLAGLDARATLALASDKVRARRREEVDELLVAAHWADLHAHPADEKDPMLSPGGEGAPEVREYAIPELGMARDVHAHTVRAMIADTLDLRHRLPLTWAKVTALACEPWVARRVAVISRAVPLDKVDVVDRAVARAIDRHSPSTVLTLAAAKVIEADPETHAMRREAERRRRYVSLSRSDEFGYRTIIAKVTAGDAAWLDAMVDRIADILVREHGHDHNRDELRSVAVGWLARPADLLQLLLDHTQPEEPGEPDTDAAEPEQAAARPRWAPHHLDRTVERLAAMSTRQLAALRGKATVFVHLTDQSLYRQAGIARVEGDGPFLVQALHELLGHADIALKPVLDLRERIRTDAYEHSDRLKDHVWTTTGGDVFPYSPRTAVRDRVDYDHPTPYDTHGPPGQTGTHNSGPLRRSHHRWKTHGGYRCRQAGHGRHLWQTPHGLCLLVDHTGTRRLTPDQAELLLTAGEGLDIHLPDQALELAPAYSPHG